VAELVFYCGTMDCGKSTLALQTDYNHASSGRRGRVFTRFDRAGSEVVSSRLGLSRPAHEVTEELDFGVDIIAALGRGESVDYLICDEVQFYTPAQVDQLARLVDDVGIDVFAFGITTDFRTRLFPGSQRLLELADRVHVLQVAALCWCGARATHNARTVDGIMVVEGEQVVPGDTGAAAPLTGRVAYEVLCRAHHRRQLTAAAAQAPHISAAPLPFDLPGVADLTGASRADPAAGTGDGA